VMSSLVMGVSGFTWLLTPIFGALADHWGGFAGIVISSMMINLAGWALALGSVAHGSIVGFVCAVFLIGLGGIAGAANAAPSLAAMWGMINPSRAGTYAAISTVCGMALLPIAGVFSAYAFPVTVDNINQPTIFYICLGIPVIAIPLTAFCLPRSCMQPHYVLKLAAAVKDPYSQGALTLPPTSRRCRQRLCSICTGFCSALGDWGSGLYRPFMLVVLACILGLVPTSSAISGTMRYFIEDHTPVGEGAQDLFLFSQAASMAIMAFTLVPYGAWIDSGSCWNIVDLMTTKYSLLQLSVVAQLFLASYSPLFAAGVSMNYLNALSLVGLPPLAATVLAPLNRPNTIARDLSFFCATPVAASYLLSPALGILLAQFPDPNALRAASGRITYSVWGYQLLYLILPLVLACFIILPTFVWIRSTNAKLAGAKELQVLV